MTWRRDVTRPVLPESVRGDVVDLERRVRTLEAQRRRYSATVGDGAATNYTVTHNLGTRDVAVTVSNDTAFVLVSPSVITLTDTNNVVVTFGSAPAADQFRVAVIS